MHHTTFAISALFLKFRGCRGFRIFFFYCIISVSKHVFPGSPELHTNQNWLYLQSLNEVKELNYFCAMHASATSGDCGQITPCCRCAAPRLGDVSPVHSKQRTTLRCFHGHLAPSQVLLFHFTDDQLPKKHLPVSGESRGKTDWKRFSPPLQHEASVVIDKMSPTSGPSSDTSNKKKKPQTLYGCTVQTDWPEGAVWLLCVRR